MSKKSDTKTRTNTGVNPSSSALAKFHLSFEYDRSWSDVKQDIQRPSK